MTRKGAAGLLLFSGGILVGALAAVLVQRTGQSNISAAISDPGVPAGTGSSDQIAALRAEYDQHISALTVEIGVLQAEMDALKEAAEGSRSNTPDGSPPRQFTVEEVRKRLEANRLLNADAVRKRKTEQLLAAGYSMDQIGHLQRRAEELAAQFRQTQTDQFASGARPLDPRNELVLGSALLVDPTFALKYEIGDAEYERYLAAQKRPTSVHVNKVEKGSILAGAGILPGDEIITFDNERVFNSAQLQALAEPGPTDIPGARVPMGVRRDGQLLQVMIPRGPITLGLGQSLSDFGDLDAIMNTPPLPPPY